MGYVSFVIQQTSPDCSQGGSDRVPKTQYASTFPVPAYIMLANLPLARASHKTNLDSRNGDTGLPHN